MKNYLTIILMLFALTTRAMALTDNAALNQIAAGFVSGTGRITILDGKDAALGSTTDSGVTIAFGGGPATTNALLKGLQEYLDPTTAGPAAGPLYGLFYMESDLSNISDNLYSVLTTASDIDSLCAEHLSDISGCSNNLFSIESQVGNFSKGFGNTDTGTTRCVLAYDEPDLNVKSPGTPWTHIGTATTTVVKSGFTVLHRIVVNSPGSGTPSITIYNNTAASGPVVAGPFAPVAGSLTYDVSLTTGCTIVTTGSTAPDITVVYH